MDVIIIVVIVLLLIGAFGSAPVWTHSATWGPWPSGALGVILLVLLILLITGRL